MASSPKNIAFASFKSTGASLKRTLADRHAEVINVRDFGALGNNSANDGPAIQAAFDAAFMTSGTPHGEANKHLNRPVEFPRGIYKVDAPGTTTAAGACLTLNQVSGGRIFSRAGAVIQFSQNLGGAGARDVTVLKTNGMVDTSIEGFQFIANSGAEPGAIGLDLDWNGVGDVGLHSNKFTGLSFNIGADVGGFTASGVRIAHQNNQGHDNVFWRCNGQDIGNRNTASVIYQVDGTNAINQNFIQSAGNNCKRIYQINGGSISSIIWGSWSTCEFGLELNNTSTCVLVGLRSEVGSILRFTAAGKIYCASGDFSNATPIMAEMVAGSTLILDAVSFAGADITGTGTLYLRASTQSALSFTGTYAQNI